MVLQFGMPGGLEMLVVFVVSVVVFGIPLVLVGVLGAMWLRADDDYDQRIRELEAEIARLQAEVGADTDGATAGGTDAATDRGSDAATDSGADAGTDSGGDTAADSGSDVPADDRSGAPGDR